MKHFRTLLPAILVAALLLAPARALAASPEPEPLELVQCDVGYASYLADLRPAFWYPVWVTLRAGEAPVEGEVAVRDPKSPLIATFPFNCAAKATRRYLVYYRFDDQPAGILHLDISGKGLRRQHHEIPVSIGPTAGRVEALVIADQPEAFRFLREFEPIAQEFSHISDLGTFNVVQGTLAHIPTNAIALEGLDTIVLATSRLRELSAEQWKAILEFVDLGGNLIVAAGQLQPFLEQAPLPKELAEAAGEARAVELAGSKMLLSPLDGEWDEVALEFEERALIAGRKHGRGMIWISAAALTREEIPAFNSIAPDPLQLWHRLLSGKADEASANALLSAWIFTRRIPERFPSQFVAFSWIFTCLGTYAALLLALWVVLRWRRRADWFWFIALLPAMAWGGTVVQRGLAGQASGPMVTFDRLTRLPSEGSQVARTVTIGGIYSPRRRMETLYLQTSSLAQDPRSSQSYVDDRFIQPDFHFDQGTSASMRNLSILPMSYRSFIIDSLDVTTATISLVVDQRSSSGLAIRNNTDADFQAWVICSGDMMTSGTLLPARAELAIPPLADGTPSAVADYGNDSAPDAIVHALHLLGYGSTRKPIAGDAFFIGVANSGAAPIEIPTDMKAVEGNQVIVQELPPLTSLARPAKKPWIIEMTGYNASLITFDALPLTIAEGQILQFRCISEPPDPERPITLSFYAIISPDVEMLMDMALMMEEELMMDEMLDANVTDEDAGWPEHNRPADDMREPEEMFPNVVNLEWEIYNLGEKSWQNLGLGSRFTVSPARDYVTALEPRMFVRRRAGSSDNKPVETLGDFESYRRPSNPQLTAYAISQTFPAGSTTTSTLPLSTIAPEVVP